jgi:hypothetical protein
MKNRILFALLLTLAFIGYARGETRKSALLQYDPKIDGIIEQMTLEEKNDIEINGSPRPPKAPAASFKRPYRKCPRQYCSHGKAEAKVLRDLRNEAPFFWQYVPACEDRFPRHRGMRIRNPASPLGIMCGEIQTGVLFANRFVKELPAIDSFLCFAIHSCGFE